jgi:hypothetical protein
VGTADVLGSAHLVGSAGVRGLSEGTRRTGCALFSGDLPAGESDAGGLDFSARIDSDVERAAVLGAELSSTAEAVSALTSLPARTTPRLMPRSWSSSISDWSAGPSRRPVGSDCLDFVLDSALVLDARSAGSADLRGLVLVSVLVTP